MAEPRTHDGELKKQSSLWLTLDERRRLEREAARRSRRLGRRVSMNEILREWLEPHLARLPPVED